LIYWKRPYNMGLRRRRKRVKFFLWYPINYPMSAFNHDGCRIYTATVKYLLLRFEL
jgi:hypothetical protein